MRLRRLRWLGLAAALATTPARAEEDTQVWTTMLAQGPVRGNLALWVEVQGRLTNGASQMGQVFFRPAVGVRIAPGATALAGYVYVYDQREGPGTSEHRPWQQLLFPVKTVAGTQLMARLRLEQRFLEGEPDMSLRQRVLLRLQPPTPSKLWPLIWAEGFWNLNDADWGPRTGFEQLRLFGGLSVPVAPRTGLELGYMRQILYRADGDRKANVASVTLHVRLGR